MATSKKISAPSADAFVRFSLGAVEVAAADALRESTDNEILSAQAVYDLLFVKHGVTVAALLPRKADDAKRTNEEAAQYDFARRFHAVVRCGADVAAKLFDGNVKGDVILQRAGISRKTGAAYKPQAKRQITQSIFNSDDWGAFVKRMATIGEARGIAAKVAAGEMSEADAEAAGKRGTGTKNPLRTRAMDTAATLCKILRTDVEKHDGSFDAKVGQKMAALISDIMSANGFK